MEKETGALCGDRVKAHELIVEIDLPSAADTRWSAAMLAILPYSALASASASAW